MMAKHNKYSAGQVISFLQENCYHCYRNFFNEQNISLHELVKPLRISPRMTNLQRGKLFFNLAECDVDRKVNLL